MGEKQAKRLCPHAIVVPPRMSAYSEASKAVFEVFEDTTPLVEGLSIDEAFLDVRGLERLAGPPTRSRSDSSGACSRRSGCRSRSASRARSSWPRSRARSRSRTACSPSPPGEELAFLHPLPVERLWGVGRVTAGKLHDRGLRTVGQVAALDEALLVYMLGQASGRHLHALAHNRDPRRVQTGRRRRSIGSQRALGRRPKSFAEIDSSVVAIVDRIARRLRTRPETVSHRRPAASVRRLHPGDTLADDASSDRSVSGDPRCGSQPPRGRAAADREARDHARRASPSRTSRTPTRSSSRSERTGDHTRSTRRSTG